MDQNKQVLDKKEQIMIAATKLFAEKGFDKTSMSAVCEKAQVSKGLIYHHFKSKNDLLREIFSKTTDDMIEQIRIDERDLIARKRLLQLINSYFDSLVTNQLVFRFNINIMLQPNTRKMLNDLIQKRASMIFDSVKKIFDTIDPINTIVMSYGLIAEFDGIAMDYLTVYENYPLDDMRKYMIDKYNI